jgi:glycerophosphoryl diester phosphodiesterase
VAHAGGAFGKQTYTNSFEAMEQSLQRGIDYLEIDFVFTSDQRLVCLHDWEDNFRRSFGYPVTEPLTLEQFEAAVRSNTKFKNCTLGSLAGWMKRNPSAVIVTDVRGDFREAMRLISQTLPDFQHRVIPQIYQPSQHSLLGDLGFRSFIWTLYRYRGTDQDVFRTVLSWEPPFAVTMPKHRAKEGGLLSALKANRIPAYVHTVNSSGELAQLRNLGVTEIYTDYLYPEGTDADR